MNSGFYRLVTEAVSFRNVVFVLSTGEDRRCHR